MNTGINRITQKEKIPEILRLAQNIEIWDFDLRELAVFLETQIESPAVFVLLDNEHNAFLLASVYRDMVTPYIVVMFAYSDPHYPDVMVDMVNSVRSWAQSLDISEIKICVKKNVKAFCKKYGFVTEGTMLRMEVQNG